MTATDRCAARFYLNVNFKLGLFQQTLFVIFTRPLKILTCLVCLAFIEGLDKFELKQKVCDSRYLHYKRGLQYF